MKGKAKGKGKDVDDQKKTREISEIKHAEDAHDCNHHFSTGFCGQSCRVDGFMWPVVAV